MASDTWSAKRTRNPTLRPTRLPQFFGDTRRQGPRRKSSRLRVGDQPGDAAAQFEAVLRQLRALAGAGIAGDDEHLIALQRLQDGLAARRDRQFGIVLEDAAAAQRAVLRRAPSIIAHSSRLTACQRLS